MGLFYKGGPSPNTTAQATQNLQLRHSDSFNRADSASIGSGWSTGHSAGGNVDVQLRNGRVELTITQVDPGNWPIGYATLNLTDPSILGRGLRSGEYLQVDMERTNGLGDAGLLLFDQALGIDPGVSESDLQDLAERPLERHHRADL